LLIRLRRDRWVLPFPNRVRGKLVEILVDLCITPSIAGTPAVTSYDTVGGDVLALAGNVFDHYDLIGLLR